MLLKKLWRKGRRVEILLTVFLFLGSTFINNTYGREINPKTGLPVKSQRTSYAAEAVPVVEYTAHNRGNIQLAIANNGTFGTLGNQIPDPFTGEQIPSCIYPKGSDVVYLWVAAVWIGAITNKGRDTLVSCGNEDWYRTTEFWPDVKPFGDFVYKSIDLNSPFYAPDAYSEQDILCEYTDTITDPNLVAMDPTDARPHKPLNIKITQRSMAWSYSYADDFILFDYQIQNIGEKELKDVYIGIYVDGDAWHTSRMGPDGWNDDIVGFYPTHRFPECCDSLIPVNIAYNADNDGDPDESGEWDYRSALSAVGVRVVRTPSRSLEYSFNWWIINYSDPTRDFGPRRQGTDEDPFRSFGSRLGTPEGDANKYYVMSHGEFDYDLLFTAVDHSRDGWLPPPQNAADYAKGWDTRFLLSFGPFDISPGQKLPVSFAWVGGENFHVNPDDFATLFDPYDPYPFYNSLDFTNLAYNSLWASWIYDNPGVDTDGDGFKGPPIICCDSITGICDTIYCEGDGVPDFLGAGPPPAPIMRIIPADGKLIVRWNGFFSETTPDVFSKIIDFEGYRVYIGRDNRPASFSVIASYDRENYNRYRYVQVTPRKSQWVLEEIPFTLDSLRTMFDDPEFDPLYWTRSRPFNYDGELYYFEPQDHNISDLTLPGGIHKVYPDAVNPGTDSTRWTPDDVTMEHGRPLPKFYEYEYVIEDLLPTVPYYIAVTTFDFGSPVAGLSSLETDPTNNTIEAYPQLPADSVEAHQLDVYVYPNPYRIDAGYRSIGYEGRLDTYRSDDRVRAIHFANLPAKCTISIYSLDGDLLKRIYHDKDPSDPQSAHNQWDLITRNNQAVVSGLYYYVVESEERTQIGKLVIIK
jgi:hypothetical protein